MPKLNRYQIYLFVLVLSYAVFEYYRPKPIDWSISYSNKDKIPFGAKALFDLLPNLLADPEVKSVRIPVYNQLKNNKSITASSNYIFINNKLKLSQQEQDLLLNYVKKGNTVFISSYYFPDSLLTVLGIQEKQHQPSVKDTAQFVNFVNPHLKTPKGAIFPRDDGRDHFIIKDSVRTTVLAVNERKEPIYVKRTYGNGNFYLHCLPLAFTNYYVLDSTVNFHAFHAFSYLPQQTTYWDEYQKQGRFGKNESSIFRYIATEPALRMAYYLALFGLVLYAVFAGKRTQRIIPTLLPPKNASLEFVRTIGNMYYRKGDHSNLSDKLVFHFRMYVRERFGIAANLPLNELEEQVAQKSGRPAKETAALFEEISYANSTGVLTTDQLKSLNKKIEDFYEKTR